MDGPATHGFRALGSALARVEANALKSLSHRERGWGEGHSPRGLRSPLACPVLTPSLVFALWASLAVRTRSTGGVGILSHRESRMLERTAKPARRACRGSGMSRARRRSGVSRKRSLWAPLPKRGNSNSLRAIRPSLQICAALDQTFIADLRCARICASTAAIAVMLTTRRAVDDGVRMCAERERPIRIGPIATPSVITRVRL